VQHLVMPVACSLQEPDLRLPVTKMNGRNVDAEAITVNYASTRKLRLLAFRSGIARGFDSSESGCGKDAASRSETAPNRRCDNIRIARGIDARSAGAVVELCPLSPQTVTPARQFSAPATDAARSAAPRFEPPPAWRAPWARPHLRHGRGGSGRPSAIRRRRNQQNVFSCQSSIFGCHSGFALRAPPATSANALARGMTISIISPVRHPRARRAGPLPEPSPRPWPALLPRRERERRLPSSPSKQTA
jgi:hypothetical protein